MLVELTISNLAIIESQSVSFGSGFNVISGETGAGKSMLLQAIELILGGRAKSELVRTGTEACEVQALFDLRSVSPEILEMLPDIARGEEIAVSRVLSASGRSKVYINGRIATLSLLSEVTGLLINICGQNQHVRLLEAAYHLELVDVYGKHESLLADYKEVWKRFRKLSSDCETLEREGARAEARREELLAVVSDIEPLDMRAGLREELEQEVKRLSNSERLIALGQEVQQCCEDSGGVETTLQTVVARLAELARIDSAAQAIYDLYDGALTDLQEGGRDLQRYCSSIEVDEDALEAARERLASVARVERKYRTNDSGLVELYKSARVELDAIEDPFVLKKLREELESCRNELQEKASALSAARIKSGRKLSQEVARELVELNMKGSKLQVALKESDFRENGADSLELMIATNKGEECRPLRKIASGGELSRILLVLKKVLRDRSGINVLVFDEVDSGVSGSVARAIGEKLKSLAEQSQVLCITHLPQVASLADQHLLVQKRTGKRAVAEVNVLGQSDRVEEIARMLAGHDVTDAARQSAKELLGSVVRT